MIINLLAGILGVVAVIGSFVMWIMAIVQCIKRPDFDKEKKALWAILCVVGGNIVSIIYFFVFGPKKFGWWALAFPSLLVVSMLLMFAKGLFK